MLEVIVCIILAPLAIAAVGVAAGVWKGVY